MKVSIRDRLEAVGASAWDGLVAASRLRSPFLSWAWQYEWVRTFAADRRLEIRCVEDGAGSLISILPLYESAPGALQLIGGADVSDYLDLISLQGREEEAWMALLQSRTAEHVEWELHTVPEMSRARVAILLGDLPRPPVRKTPPRAPAKDATSRTRRARRPRIVRERAGRHRRAARRLSPAPPKLAGGQSAVHGRADGAVLPRRARGVRRARGCPALVSRHGVGSDRGLRHDRMGRHGRALQLGFRARAGRSLAGCGPAGAADPGRDRARAAEIRLPQGRGAVQVRVRARPRGRLPGEDPVNLHVAMLSVHTCPLAALGGKETGGMNVYVREVSRELGRMGVSVDVFTRSQDPSIPRVVSLGERARVIHLPAGDEAPMARVRVHAHLDEFVDGVEAWRIARSIEYDLIHAHYWLSGVAAMRLKARWSVPVMQMR